MGTKSIKCKRCDKPKILANERIIQTGVCYQCTGEIVPNHIPESQHIQYLQMKGYNKKPLKVDVWYS
jgi:hypothetical protein